MDKISPEEKIQWMKKILQVLFLFYEIIARRKPSDKFMEYAQMAGMFLLFGLLIWANFNDILRFFF